MVFDEITLDAGLSDDPDGTIEDYAWQINPMGDSSTSISAFGEGVTISDLAPGFYEVALIVTDDDGLTGTAEMIFSAIGKKGDLNLDGDVDGLDLSEFADVYGH